MERWDSPIPPSFALALQLLTRIPVASPQAPIAPQMWGRAALWFPVVGLVIGLVLFGVRGLLWFMAPQMLAALLLALWVLLTGALHIDGLADVADAWIGGRGDRERTLALMKDPRSGPIAIAAVVLLLLNEWTALQVLCAHEAGLALVLAPIWGRMVIIMLLLTTPYVRPEGLGALYAAHMPRWAGALLVLVGVGATLALLALWGAVLLGVICVGVWGWRRHWMSAIGGMTGDTLGAACILTEMATLIVLAQAMG